jgi:3-oxo-4-pregnene-20-carboxyl-CoA dehydrogenase alpha subunit
MDFDLSETQQEIARLAADILGAVSSRGLRPPDPPTTPASPGRETPPGPPQPGDPRSSLALVAADPWKELARSGLLALAVPTELGGDGLGVLEVAVLLTEVGRRAVPVPALATLMTGVLPIARWGDESLNRELLPAAASGDLILTAAFREALDASPARREALDPSPARRDAPYQSTMVDDGRVSGTKVGVLYAAEAGRLLVSARLCQAATDADTCVVLVDPDAGGVTIIRTPSSTGDPEYTVRFDDAPVVATLPGMHSRDLLRLAVAGACCVADGALAGALALTRDYIATRRQFGRPLAEFQAVSQQIADIYIASRTLHLATLSACWRLHTGRDPDADLDIAAWWLREEALDAVMTCHHLHGGIGVDISYPLHRLSSLIRDLSRYLGDAGVH